MSEQPIVTSSEQEAAPVAEKPVVTTSVQEVRPADDDDDEQDDTGDTATSDGDDAPAPRRNKGAKARINELTREKYEALRDVEQLRRENEALRNPQQQRQPQQARPAQADSPDKPTLAGHDFDQEAYSEALADWKVEQKFAEWEDRANQAKAQKTAQEKAAAFKGREAAFAADNPDYYDIAYTAPIDYSEAMLGAIQESDDAPAIAYYLAQHLDEAADIAQMSHFAAVKAIDRIEARLSAPIASTYVPRPPSSVTKAPAPVATLRPAAPIKKSLEDMPMDEYAQERNRQRKAAGLTR